ncbi:MAG: fructose PTS transporter subunit IIA [Eubacteriales bacterium]|nr:fructose PTS transporter subunit IIA [Eubacteriales bacterium]
MLITEELIALNLSAKTKNEAIHMLAEKAAAAGRVADVAGYVEAVLHREGEYSTGMGFGVAIPHGKTNAVIEPLLLYATVDSMDWQSLDGNPIDVIFMIGVPADNAGDVHLRILANLSRRLMKEDFRTNLRAATTPTGVLQVLKDYEIGL